MLFDEWDETRRAHLLLAFDEHLDIDLQIVAERLERTGMNGYATAIIGGSTAIQSRTNLRADEWIGIPSTFVGHRLYVMMCIQQHGRSMLVNDLRADDLPRTWCAIGIMGLHHLCVNADLSQLLGHEFGGTPHMFGGDAFRGDRLQCDLPIEHVDDAIPITLHTCTDVIGK